MGRNTYLGYRETKVELAQLIRVDGRVTDAMIHVVRYYWFLLIEKFKVPTCAYEEAVYEAYRHLCQKSSKYTRNVMWCIVLMPPVQVLAILFGN